MGFDVEVLLRALETHPYLLLFPLAVLEGPVVAMAAGLLVYAGIITWPVAYALIVAADLAGDTLHYLAGRLGRHPRFGRLLASLGLTEGRLAYLASSLRRHEWRVLVGAKLTHFAGAPALVAAGLGGVPYGRFLGWNLLATVPKSAFFLALGYFSGGQIENFARYLDVGSAAALALVVVFLAAWLAYSRRRARARDPGPEPVNDPRADASKRRQEER